MNKDYVTLTGVLGKDPEFRDTANGNLMAKFSLARGWWDPQAKERVTTWVNVVAFGEFLNRRVGDLEKGQKVTIIGELGKLGLYDGKNGSVIDVNVTLIDIAMVQKAPSKQEVVEEEDDLPPFEEVAPVQLPVKRKPVGR